MTRNEFGLLLIVATMALTILGCIVVTYIYPIEWFRERLLSEDRWTRAIGALPIGFPLYIVTGILFSNYRR